MSMIRASPRADEDHRRLGPPGSSELPAGVMAAVLVYNVAARDAALEQRQDLLDERLGGHRAVLVVIACVVNNQELPRRAPRSD